MSEDQLPQKGVRLSYEEAWETLTNSHTGVFTTLRRDGTPISLPVWYAVIDRKIYVSTPGNSKKVMRIKNNSRSSFLVESGELWAELKAVHLTGTAEIVQPFDELAGRMMAEIERKYSAFRTAPKQMPDASKKHYGQTSATIRFTPDERIVSWDNSKLNLK